MGTIMETDQPKLNRRDPRQSNPRLYLLEALPSLAMASWIEMTLNGPSPLWARIKQAEAILDSALQQDPEQAAGVDRARAILKECGV